MICITVQRIYSGVESSVIKRFAYESMMNEGDGVHGGDSTRTAYGQWLTRRYISVAQLALDINTLYCQLSRGGSEVHKAGRHSRLKHSLR
jgi:hypothetical protein